MNILITGGAGFVGCNVANYYLNRKCSVEIFDNLSRKGTTYNYQWLKGNHKNNFSFVKGDIRTDIDKLKTAVTRAEIVFHFAAQVAVTTSIIDPKEDFEVNAKGTLNVLEAIRETGSKPILIFSSTNKVYGDLEKLTIIEKSKRFDFKDRLFAVNEEAPLDFHSPYGCSKGCADQYVRDYSRIYGLRTIIFRKSCIYGERQFGIEDQGWVAWFIIASILNRPITIYGDGKQVRDVLYIGDLINAYDLAIKNIHITSGKIYNIGGGRENSISILEFIEYLEKIRGKKLQLKYSKPRSGDQKIFISDNSKAMMDFNWEPKIQYSTGFKNLYNWVLQNKELIKNIS